MRAATRLAGVWAAATLALLAVTEAQWVWTTNTDNTLTVTKYTGAGGVAVIPERITGLPVVNIGGEAFAGYSNLNSITIPITVTNIGMMAFVGCDSLTNAVIGSNVTSIGREAFGACTNLTSVTIPASVTDIGQMAFVQCRNLTNVTIPASVARIELNAFLECDRLTAIGVDVGNPAYSSVDGVLFDKSQARLIEYPGGMTGSYSIPPNVTNIANEAFYDCNRLTSVTIPNGVTSIGDRAFELCTSLTGVYFKGDAPFLGNDVFAGDVNTTLYYLQGTKGWDKGWNGWFGGCPTAVWKPEGGTATNAAAVMESASLRESFSWTTNADKTITIMGYVSTNTQVKVVVVPDRINGLPVNRIGCKAFHLCTNLTSVTIPASVTSIGKNAFGHCGLTNIAIGSSVTDIGGGVFSHCTNLTAVTVDARNPVYSSVDGVLFDRNRTTVIQCPGGKTGSYSIPASVSCIAEEAFAGCRALTNVVISSSVTNIGEEAFSECSSLTNVIIPANINRIRDATFRGCALTGVTIPDSVTSIGEGAFACCDGLNKITIPANVTSLGWAAFGACGNLIGIYFKGNAPDFDSLVFCCNGNERMIVYYKSGTKGWGSTFGDPPRPTRLWVESVVEGQYCYTPNDDGTATLTGYTGKDAEVTIPRTVNNRSVTCIGDGAFYRCSGMQSVRIPDSTTDIGDEAFGSCTSLTNVIIPSSVTNIGKRAFSDCSSLTNVSIPANISRIRDGTFRGCALTHITIPNSVTNIDSDAFFLCPALTGVYFRGNAPTLGDSVFHCALNATVYYLEGTKGWSPTFGGRPTAVWKTQGQDSVQVTNAVGPSPSASTNGIDIAAGLLTFRHHQKVVLGGWSCVETNRHEFGDAVWTTITMTHQFFGTNNRMRVEEVVRTPRGQDAGEQTLSRTCYGNYGISGNELTVRCKGAKSHVSYGINAAFSFAISGDAMVVTNKDSGEVHHYRRVVGADEVTGPWRPSEM